MNLRQRLQRLEARLPTSASGPAAPEPSALAEFKDTHAHLYGFYLPEEDRAACEADPEAGNWAKEYYRLRDEAGAEWERLPILEAETVERIRVLAEQPSRVPGGHWTDEEWKAWTALHSGDGWRWPGESFAEWLRRHEWCLRELFGTLGDPRWAVIGLDGDASGEEPAPAGSNGT